MKFALIRFQVSDQIMHRNAERLVTDPYMSARAAGHSETHQLEHSQNVLFYLLNELDSLKLFSKPDLMH